jgi:hypothetical protein
VTPPVTKTYFAIARFSSGGFSNSTDVRPIRQTVAAGGQDDCFLLCPMGQRA